MASACYRNGTKVHVTEIDLEAARCCLLCAIFGNIPFIAILLSSFNDISQHSSILLQYSLISCLLPNTNYVCAHTS